MADLSQQTARALAHTRRLAEEIGPRPAGSPAETQALDYAQEVLSQAGLPARRLPARFAPYPLISWSLPLVGLALAAASLLWLRLPALGLLPILLSALLPELTRLEDRLRPLTAESGNVYAQIGGRAEQPMLLFCAHADSARAGPFDAPILRRLYARALFLLQRAALLLAAAALLRLLGLPVPPLIPTLVSAAGLLAGGWFAASDLLASLAHRGRWSPGANDNAAGVAVLLALAEALAPAPPPGLRLGFLVCGAEETGLHGSAAFAAGPDFPPGEVAVINLDMIGAGSQLHYVSQEGGLFPLKTSARLNGLLRQADPAITPIRYVVKSGDYAPFLRRGIPAASLQSTGAPAAEQAYHTISDHSELIEPDALERVLGTLHQVVILVSEAGRF